MRTWVAISLASVGCAGDVAIETTGQAPEDQAEAEQPVEEAPEADLPSAHEFTETSDGPLLSLDEVAVALETNLLRFWISDPRDIFDTFDAVIADGDDDCPTTYNLLGHTYYQGFCTSESGIYYDGIIYGRSSSGHVESNVETIIDTWWYGDFAATYPDGRRWDLSGYFRLIQSRYLGSETTGFEVQTVGYVGWTPLVDPAAWLDGGISMGLDIDGLGSPEGSSQVVLNGGVSTHANGAAAITFDQVYLGSGESTSCPLEPSNTISILDTEGHWYDVRFDGPPYPSAVSLPAECDGCGQVSYDDEVLGTVCLDFASLMDWEVLPW